MVMLLRDAAPCVAALRLNSTPVIACYTIHSYFTCKHSAVCQIVY